MKDLVIDNEHPTSVMSENLVTFKNSDKEESFDLIEDWYDIGWKLLMTYQYIKVTHITPVAVYPLPEAANLKWQWQKAQ